MEGQQMSQKSLKRRKLGCQPTTKFHGEISVFLTGYQEKLSKEIGSLTPQILVMILHCKVQDTST